MITVRNEKDSTIQEIIFTQQTVKQLLEKLSINPETVLVVKDNTVLTQDEQIEDNDTLEILSVISGG